MYSFKKLNNYTGWAIFALAALVYILTLEPTASFWDPGEFIAASYRLQVPHPPGAPLFLLIGRMFSFLAFGDGTQVAYWINFSSGLASAFTILFLFWSITLLGRRVVRLSSDQVNLNQALLILGSGAIGALAYTFSDTFWFSAVEAEVYAMSSMFTAFVFWAILKWEVIEDEKKANQWLILLAYTVGLSIGVHLLNLVSIPVLGLIYYFKKYEKVSFKGIVVALGAGGAIVMLIMLGIIPGLPSLAGSIEIFFVNSIGLPFGSGIIFLFIVFIGALVYGILYSIKKEKVLLNTVLLCFTFILIGYASYAMVVIRSNANPPIDQNNPENIISFVSYLKREQYGDRPLLYGQYFTAEIVKQERSRPVYVKGEDKYEIVDYRISNEYDPKHSTFLPRAYSTEDRFKSRYEELMNLRPGEKPSFIDNLQYMFSYQIGHMYLRYFMWNFAGREHDMQGAGWLGFWDTAQELPEAFANNKARNNYLMLPLILGFIGLFFHFRKDEKGFWIVTLFFFLTGIALVLYLNSPPSEPRERDYIYVGSFYAFAIWLGFGVMGIAELLSGILKKPQTASAVALLLSFSVPAIMAAEGWDDHDRSNRYFSTDSARNHLSSCAPNAILFTGGDNDTFPLWYAQDVEGFRTDVRVIVLSYFNTDWYINQMTRQTYESEPLPFSLDQENYRQGGPNDYLLLDENPNVQDGIKLSQFLSLVKRNHQAIRRQVSANNYINTVPSRKLHMDINKADILSKGIVPAEMEDLIPERITFNIKGRHIEKKDLMILDLIANSNWDRPIYFNNTSLMSIAFDVNPYVVQEGITFRLMPVQNPDPNEPFVNKEVMAENMLEKFYYRELDNPNVYYDENYRNFMLGHRSAFNRLAEAYLDAGDTEKASNIIHTSLERIPDEGIRYDYETASSVGILLELGERERALEIADLLATRANENLEYLINTRQDFSFERAKNLNTMNQLVNFLKAAGEDEMADKYQDAFMQHYSRISR